MHFGGRFLGRSSRASLLVPHAPKTKTSVGEYFRNLMFYLPAPPGISCGSISNCFEPHGQSVSTTRRIRLLCGIF